MNQIAKRKRFQSPRASGHDRWCLWFSNRNKNMFKLKSIEDIWVCLLVCVLNAYLIYDSYVKCHLAKTATSTTTEASKCSNLVFLIFFGLECLVLLPVYLLTSFFELGANANANYKYGKDLDLANELEFDEDLAEFVQNDSKFSKQRQRIGEAASVPLLSSRSDNDEFEQPVQHHGIKSSCLQSFWRFNMPPVSSLVHIILALSILYSNLVLTGNQIEKGLTPKSYIYHNELDIIFSRPLERVKLRGNNYEMSTSNRTATSGLASINFSSPLFDQEEVIDVREINYEPKLSFELINLLIALVIFQLKYTKTLWHFNKLFSLCFLLHLLIVSILILVSFATYQVLYKYELYHLSSLNYHGNDSSSAGGHFAGEMTLPVTVPPTTVATTKTASRATSQFHYSPYESRNRGHGGKSAQVVKNNHLLVASKSNTANQTAQRSDRARDLYNFESIYRVEQQATALPIRALPKLPFLSSPQLTLPIGYLLTVVALLVSSVPIYMYAIHRYHELFEILKRKFLKFMLLNRLVSSRESSDSPDKFAEDFRMASSNEKLLRHGRKDTEDRTTTTTTSGKHSTYCRFTEDSDATAENSSENSAKTNLLIKNLTNELMKLNEDHFNAAAPPPLPSLPPPSQQGTSSDSAFRLIESFIQKKQQSSDDSDETCGENSSTDMSSQVTSNCNFKAESRQAAEKVFSSSSPIGSNAKETNEPAKPAAVAVSNAESSSPTSSICFESKKAAEQDGGGQDISGHIRPFQKSRRKLYSKLSTEDEAIYKDVDIRPYAINAHFYDDFINGLEMYNGRSDDESYYKPYKSHLLALTILLFMCFTTSFLQVYDSVCLYQLTNDRLALVNAILYVGFIIWYILFWLVLTLTTTSSSSSSYSSLLSNDELASRPDYLRSSKNQSSKLLLTNDNDSKNANTELRRFGKKQPPSPTGKFYKFELNESFKMSMWFSLNEFVKAFSPARPPRPSSSAQTRMVSCRDLRETQENKISSKIKADEDRRHYLNDHQQVTSGHHQPLIGQLKGSSHHVFNRQSETTPCPESSHIYDNSGKGKQPGRQHLSTASSMTNLSAILNSSESNILEKTARLRIDINHHEDRIYSRNFDRSKHNIHLASGHVGVKSEWDRVYSQAQSLVNINNGNALRIEESRATHQSSNKPQGAYSSENLINNNNQDAAGNGKLRDSQKLSPLMENLDRDSSRRNLSSKLKAAQDDHDGYNQMMLVKEKPHDFASSSSSSSGGKTISYNNQAKAANEKKLGTHLEVQELLILKLGDDADAIKKTGGYKDNDIMMKGLASMKETAILAVAASADSKMNMTNSKVCNYLNKIVLNDSSEVSIASSSSMSASITPPPSSSASNSSSNSQQKDQSQSEKELSDEAAKKCGAKSSLDSYASSSNNSKSGQDSGLITNAECDSSSSNLEPSLNSVNETNYRITLRQKAHEIYSLNSASSQSSNHQRPTSSSRMGWNVEKSGQQQQLNPPSNEFKVKNQSRNNFSENNSLSTPSSTVGTVTTASSSSSTSSTSSSPPTYPSGDMAEYFQANNKVQLRHDELANSNRNQAGASRQGSTEPPDTNRFSSNFDNKKRLTTTPGLGFCREAGTFTSKCTLSSGNSVIMSQTMQKLQQQPDQHPRLRPSFHQSTSINPIVAKPTANSNNGSMHIKKSTSFVNNANLLTYHHHNPKLQNNKMTANGKREPGSSSIINDREQQFSYLLRPFVLRSNRSHSSNMSAESNQRNSNHYQSENTSNNNNNSNSNFTSIVNISKQT